MIIRIYALIDPITTQPHYIGRTNKTLATRLHGHTFRQAKQPSGAWVHGLLKQGITPLIEEIDSIVVHTCRDDANAKKLESFWINYFLFIGADLKNQQFIKNRGSSVRRPRKISVNGQNGYEVSPHLVSRTKLEG